jgi:hypothetical protein
MNEMSSQSRQRFLPILGDRVWWAQDLVCYPPYSQSNQNTFYWNFVTAQPQDPGAMQGFGWLKSSATATSFAKATSFATVTLTTNPKMEAPVRLAKPPRLWPSQIARIWMSKKRYQRQWEPLIADMNSEYYECLAEHDEATARRVVIRHNLKAIPRWVKLLALTVALRVIDWLRSWAP